MSAATLNRITERLLARLPTIKTVDDALALLREQTVAFARHSAERLYLKVSTEPGWTNESASRLGDKILQEYFIDLADLVQSFGGTVEMACTLAQTASTAFGLRLQELSSAPNIGGAA